LVHSHCGVLRVGSETRAFVGASRHDGGRAGYHACCVAGGVVGEDDLFVCDGDEFDFGLVGIDERGVVLVLADLILLIRVWEVQSLAYEVLYLIDRNLAHAFELC
jgi:hypothetical protein